MLPVTEPEPRAGAPGGAGGLSSSMHPSDASDAHRTVASELARLAAPGLRAQRENTCSVADAYGSPAELGASKACTSADNPTVPAPPVHAEPLPAAAPRQPEQGDSERSPRAESGDFSTSGRLARPAAPGLRAQREKDTGDHPRRLV